MSEIKPVGFYCDHSDEPLGKRTHEGWAWTADDDMVWQRQPDVISSHQSAERAATRRCPRAVPVYAVDVPALLAERDRARADAKGWHDTYQQQANADDEFFGVLLDLLPGAADEGADAYDQIPRGIEKLKAEQDRLAEQVRQAIQAAEDRAAKIEFNDAFERGQATGLRALAAGLRSALHNGEARS
ncbi:hypothetical protein [Actinomadura rugatobispora]|uniref:Uncharacterized protein n=1 Tax=Actinomadura rugatobispora TaxID=1994 RepID=A0ABW0ZRU5_9ACTN|nr:hypothetical protein GCM10010200_035870 [Actinomadura rugatobispora]